MNNVLDLIKAQEAKGGVDLSKLKTDNTVYAKTRNSLYVIKPLENGNFMVQGGTRMPEPMELFVSGSTWGGSMLAMKWIGIGMHIEMQNPDPSHDLLITTAVQNIRITGPDWEYEIK